RAPRSEDRRPARPEAHRARERPAAREPRIRLQLQSEAEAASPPAAAPALLLTWAGGRARLEGPGARALDRLARLRRQRRRPAERIRRLRPAWATRRCRSRARDEGEAQPRGGARGRCGR